MIDPVFSRKSWSRAGVRPPGTAPRKRLGAAGGPAEPLAPAAPREFATAFVQLLSPPDVCEDGQALNCRRIMRILIIDDSRTMRNLLRAFVAPLAAEIFEAPDGREALRQVELHWPIDVALVDWDMPIMDGLTLVKSIRAEPRYQPLKLMMVTSKNSMDAVVEAMKCGADDYLMKPLNEEMVMDKLRVLGLLD